MNFKLSKLFFILTLLFSTQVFGLSKTNGTPIGGMGTGYIIYNAVSGDFATSQKIPPAASDGVMEVANKRSKSSGFHFFVDGDPVNYLRKAKTDSEDAKCPLYTAYYGKIGKSNVSFTLNAFGPYVPGDKEINYQLATSPLAFFEITAKNDGDKAVDAAAAMEFTNTSNGKNLLGGSNTGESASNNSAIAWNGSSDIGNAYMLVDCSDSSAKYSAGLMGTFSSDGMLQNGSGNIVAAKCNIPAHDSVRFKFTMAWWRTFISTADRYNSGKPDSDNYYYHNFYPDSKSAAEFGKAHFDMVGNAVKSIVSRVMGSNFPYWYKERLLNNLYPMIHNSVWTKDGRTAFWEGHYAIIGTLDQGEHASLWYTFNWPKNQWQELRYWLHSAHTGENEEATLKGQIHHDFNIGPNQWNLEAHFLAPWDNYLRNDYWWSQNTTNWSDLNSMAIFKAYELMLATGNLDSMKTYFPKVLATADRLLYMCTLAGTGKHLPTTSKSTYDQNSVITPQYASGVALAAFLAVEAMAKFVGDTATALKYREWYTAAREEYKNEQFTSSYASGRDFCEGDVAGYSWAHYMGLGPIMDADFINEACKRLWRYYSTKAGIRDKLGQWHFYTYDHFGGAEIAIGKPDTALIINKWDYDYYYTQKPATVFWQDLQKTNTAYASYMTAPCVWRSYFQMTGYLLDNANKRLWIRPSIPSEMKKQIVNAPLLNPYGWGNLNYDETVKDNQTQSITVSFDSSVSVKELVLKNNTVVDKPFVQVVDNETGIVMEAKTVNTDSCGLEKNIRVTFESPIQIGKIGVRIGVYNSEVGVVHKLKHSRIAALSITENVIRAGRQIHFTVDMNGPVSMELLSLNGAKIGTIMQKTVSAGKNSFFWNGRTTNGSPVKSSVLILRLKSQSGIFSKKILTN